MPAIYFIMIPTNDTDDNIPSNVVAFSAAAFI
jgi:hypothetical protein